MPAPRTFGKRQEPPAGSGKRQMTAIRTSGRSDTKNTAPANSGKIVALIATPLIVLLYLGMGWLFIFFNESREELNSFIEPAIVEMVAGEWSSRSVEKYASPKFKVWLRNHGVPEQIRELKRLGPIVRYEGVDVFKGFSFSKNLSDGRGDAQAIILVEFASGERTFYVGLQRLHDHWYINTLSLSP